MARRDLVVDRSNFICFYDCKSLHSRIVKDFIDKIFIISVGVRRTKVTLNLARVRF